MYTLAEILKKTSLFLNKKRLEKPKLEAELLLAHVLKCKRLDLYLNFEQLLDQTTLDTLRPLVIRRGNREPLQYILGQTVFGECLLKTDPRALIPRPETEYMCELIINKCDPSHTKKILDLGTGTGAIAIYLAKHLPESILVATDRCPLALSLAKENIEAQGLQGRIHLVQSEWFSHIEGQFDLIVSNPPYLTLQEVQTAQSEVKDFEPFSALTPYNESNSVPSTPLHAQGLSDLIHILEKAPSFLTSQGLLCLETGILHHAALGARAGELGYSKNESIKDLNKLDRYFFSWFSCP